MNRNEQHSTPTLKKKSDFRFGSGIEKQQSCNTT